MTLKRAKEFYAKLADTLDKRQRFKDLLIAMYDAHGKVPPEYRYELKLMLAEDPRPWSQRKLVVFKLKLAALLMAWKNRKTKEPVNVQ